MHPRPAALALVLVAALASTVAVTSAAPARDTPLPDGPGLSAKHPGDRGIERAKGVLVAESFEDGDVAALSKRWTEVKNPGGPDGGKVLSLADDAPAGAHGSRSLEITATVGDNTGGHLYRTYEESDRVFVRFYVKFLDPEYIHHFVTFGGYRPATRWPQGHAGERPRGDERFTVAIEPHGNNGRREPPGAWTFYNYWHEMKPSARGRHWGNGLAPAATQRVPLDRWQCVEVMVKLNSVLTAGGATPDGELALWLDGKLVADFHPGAHRGPWTGMGFQLRDSGTGRDTVPFEGFRWRTDTKLRANFLTLSHYVTEGAMRRNGIEDPTGREVRVRFDHVVVADRYVGPIVPRR